MALTKLVGAFLNGNFYYHTSLEKSPIFRYNAVFYINAGRLSLTWHESCQQTGNANWSAAHYFGRDVCYNFSEVVWMTFEVKLKTGFFRTRSYYLTIGQGRLVLTPQDSTDDVCVVIDASQLQSIYLAAGEFEVIADNIYTGSFAPHTNLYQLSCLLATEFGEKFSVQFELP